MTKRRNYHRYELKRGNEILYIGITNDPEDREEEHRAEGKRFGHMRTVGPAVTKDTAEEWEEERLEAYRTSHGGRNPRYNETDK